tara:strand:- start:2146 stop:2475 length:330 start_codon:yes stop_codon:yes gene_type:complete
MRYKKGVSGNPNGRPKGALNKSTNQVRDILTKAHANNFDLIMQQINELTLKERLQFNRDILPYIAPKLSNIAIKEDTMTYDEMVQDLQMRESLKMLSTDELLNMLKEED